MSKQNSNYQAIEIESTKDEQDKNRHNRLGELAKSPIPVRFYKDLDPILRALEDTSRYIREAVRKAAKEDDLISTNYEKAQRYDDEDIGAIKPGIYEFCLTLGFTRDRQKSIEIPTDLGIDNIKWIEMSPNEQHFYVNHMLKKWAQETVNFWWEKVDEVENTSLSQNHAQRSR